jgi:ribonuclease HI
MEAKCRLDRRQLSLLLEVVGERLPAELYRAEFPELGPEAVRLLFHGLAEHVRQCGGWHESDVSPGHGSGPAGTGTRLYCDGASRGNPGPAGAGALLLNRDGTHLCTVSRFLDTATNNEAEYQALLSGLSAAMDLGIKDIHIFLDSELVVKQVRGQYRVRHPRLQLLFDEVMSRLQRFDEYAIFHITRENNRQADRLANEAIDRGLQGGEREVYWSTRRE